jgi:hypothetical protein
MTAKRQKPHEAYLPPHLKLRNLAVISKLKQYIIRCR